MANSLVQAAINPIKHSQSNDSFFNAFGGGGGGKKGGAAPTPPDYIGAAREQGLQNIDLARVNAQLSNPNFSNPYGQRTVKFGADTLTPEQQAARGPKPTMDEAWARYDAAHQARFGSAVPRNAETQGHVDADLAQRMADWSGVSPNAVTISDTLNPQQQQMFDTQQRMSGQLLNRAEENFSRPFGFGGADDLQNKAEEAYLARLEPQFQRSEDALRTRLATQGIDPYGEAAQKEYERQAFARNDATGQAVLKAYGMRPQMLQEEAAIRSMPLNELSALQTGSPVQMPQFQGYSGVAAQPAPTFEAVQNQGLWDQGLFNMQQQRAAGATNGAVGLGVAAMPYLMSFL